MQFLGPGTVPCLPVVVVISTEAVNVKGDASLHGKRVENVRDHLAAQVANLLSLESEFRNAVGTRGDIDDSTAESLVEGSVASSVAANALDWSKSLLERSTERKCTVLCRVVVVDPEVTLTSQRQRHATVLGQSVKHLEKRT